MQVKEQVRQPSGYLFTCEGNENPAPAIQCLYRLLIKRRN